MSSTAQPESKQRFFDRYLPLVFLGYIAIAAISDTLAVHHLWLGVAVFVCANMALAVLFISSVLGDRHKPMWGTRPYVITMGLMTAMLVSVTVIAWYEILHR